MRANYCEYGNHEIIREKHGGYIVLSDEKRGLKDIQICRACYRDYILENFPGSRMANYILNNPSEYPAHHKAGQP